MRALLLVTLLALALPVAHATDVHARNAAFLWTLMGQADPAQLATLHDGRAMPLASAIHEAAARAGNVDLAAIVSGASADPDATNAADVWVIEIGSGECERVELAPALWFGIPIHQQFWLYAGYYGTLSTTQGDSTTIIGWTTKSATTQTGTAGFTAAGQTDGYCIQFGGLHIAFPFIDGIATIMETI